MCFHKGPLVYTLVMWMLYFSQFFPSFFIGLHRICLCAKVRNLDFIICSVANRSKVEWISYIFLNEKRTTLFCPQFIPQSAGNRIFGLWNFKIFWGFMPPDPCRKRSLVNTVGNSIQTHWLLVSLLKLLRGPRDIVYSGNMAHLDCERHTFLGSFGHMILWERFLRLKFSEMLSSAFWTLKFSKCLDSILNVMLIYFINHRCGCGQRSN